MPDYTPAGGSTTTATKQRQPQKQSRTEPESGLGSALLLSLLISEVTARENGRSPVELKSTTVGSCFHFGVSLFLPFFGTLKNHDLERN